MQKCIRAYFRSQLLLLLLLPQSLLAGKTPSPPASQTFEIRTWQTDDGLPQNWVSSIGQTSDGYLWIGTRYGGLARFDGVRFSAFNPENTPQLRDVQVEHVVVDPDSAVWAIMGNESITRFKDGQFELFRLPRAEPRLRGEFFLKQNGHKAWFADEEQHLASLDLSSRTNRWTVFAPNPPARDQDRSFWCDQDGVIWCLMRDGRLSRLGGNTFRIYSSEIPQLRNKVTAGATDSGGHLWVTTASRIFRWDGSHFQDETPTNYPAAIDISQITPSPDGGAWVLADGRLRKCWHQTWVADVLLPQTVQRDNNSHAPQLYADSQGNAWFIDYGHGLWRIKSDGSTFELTEKDGLPSAFITCWFQDRESNIWIGTAGGGLACIRKRMVHVLGQDTGLPGKIARSVCMDKQGTLWVGTMSGGLAYWKDNRFIPLNLPSYNPATPLESVTVCPDDDGSLWIGSLRHGLMQLHDGKIRRPVSGNDINSVRILFKDSQDRIWIGGLADLTCYANGHLKRFGGADGFQGGVAIGGVAEDASGAIWIGTGPGDLWKYQGNRFTRFTPPGTSPSFRLAALRPDTDGTVWIGTLGGGLLRFKDGVFFRYTSKLGLPNAYISQLLDDHQGHLWAGTYAGIVRFSKTNLHAVAEGRNDNLVCHVYGHSSGLLALECSSGFQPSCWQSPSGRLFWATANGLAYVDPEETLAHHLPPSVIIEEMQVDGRLHPFNPTVAAGQDGPPTRIEPGRHFIQFQITGLSFEAPDEVQFRARLEGAEKTWRDLHHQRTIGYGPLAPGHYRLQVEACNSEGLWNEQGASLSFEVLPFFWQTWWFKTVLVTVSFLAPWLLIILVLRRRHRLEMQKLKYQHELDRERARIAQDLHDDLGTSLTQISLLSALADRKIAEDESKSFNQQIRERAREMVSALDEIVWAVNPRNDSLMELANYLGNYAEEFFRPTSTRCRLEIPDHVPARPLSSETRHHLFLAFKESLNNTMRHSRASQIEINIEIQPNEVLIRISDDGRGFDMAKQAQSGADGLLNIKSRLEQMGGRAEIQSAPGQGTFITLRLPLK